MEGNPVIATVVSGENSEHCRLMRYERQARQARKADNHAMEVAAIEGILRLACNGESKVVRENARRHLKTIYNIAYDDRADPTSQARLKP